MLRIDPDEPEADLVDWVAQRIEAGEVVALPTDTFYGLAVDPVNLRAVERIERDLLGRSRVHLRGQTDTLPLSRSFVERFKTM